MAASCPQADISWLCCWCGAGDTEQKEKGKKMKGTTDRKTPPSCYRDDRDVVRQKPHGIARLSADGLAQRSKVILTYIFIPILPPSSSMRQVAKTLSNARSQRTGALHISLPPPYVPPKTRGISERWLQNANPIIADPCLLTGRAAASRRQVRTPTDICWRPRPGSSKTASIAAVCWLISCPGKIGQPATRNDRSVDSFSLLFFLRPHHVGAMSLSRGVHGTEDREATNTTAPRAVAKCFANGPTSGRPACLPDMRSSQRSPVCLFIVVRSCRRQLFNRAGSLVDAGGRSRWCPSTCRRWLVRSFGVSLSHTSGLPANNGNGSSPARRYSGCAAQ
ncbi:uncharacterized protein J3D65DRAFT_262315 [Phyllosticta citribraziliensis]|uniref:Uncharacterized protein n=1 Tax=Phyllosticta citribraziliensis TaxID=989973 RepID=A0ABR1M0J8_9PEZI